MIFDLKNSTEFPDPKYGHPSGFYAVGGDISADRLIKAYPLGIFPWYAYKEGQIHWWAPQRRFVILPEEIEISHSMRNHRNKGIHTCTINEDFEGVLLGCCHADNRSDDPDAWLGPELMETWMELNRRGYAKSVEVWNNEGYLVGGLYGFVVGGCFIGDSMFSLETNASKTALIFLAEHMQEQGGILIDCQLKTKHLESMGGKYISYEKYLKATQESKPIIWDK